MSTHDNAPPLDGFHVPARQFCARLLGDDLCDCPTCQLDAHVPPKPLLDGRGDN